MRRGAQLRTALAKVRLISVHGPWWRILSFRDLLQAPGGKPGFPQPLWGGGPKRHGARFTPKGGFDSLYLAGDPVTALAEVRALVILPGSVVPLRTTPWTMVTVDGIVSYVLDLTDAATLNALGTHEQEMSGPWARSAKPPTQELAKVAFQTGRISGIRYASAKHPGGVNLVIFPDRLVPPSTDYLEVHDPHGKLAQRLGG